MASAPDIYIFDEPTAGQDRAGLLRLNQIIEDLHSVGKTVITITHDIEFAIHTFDRIVVMAHKKIVKDGSVKEVFQDEEVLKKAMLKPPYAMRLAKDLSLNADIITNEQFIEELLRRS